MSGTWLFAGPTLARVTARERLLDGIELRPPIARGDLAQLVAQHAHGIVVICDGVFHMGRLAVGHGEIRTALARGWRVWGVSSMGAIRAAEMGALGMRGHGAVFARFRDDPDFTDDEVTLLHEPEPPWRELSEPLVHMRCAIDDLVAQGALSAARGAAIITELAASWFGERTLARFSTSVRNAGAMIDLRTFDRYRIKVTDLTTLLEQRPFEEAA